MATPDRPRNTSPVANAVPGQFRGHIDGIVDGRVQGWAVDLANPGRVLEIEVLWDDRTLGRGTAGGHRPDLAGIGYAGNAGGFSIAIPQVLIEGRGGVLRLREADAREPVPGELRLRSWAERLRFAIDGYVSAEDLGGWVQDRENPSTIFTVEVLEDAARIAIARCDTPHEQGGFGRFTVAAPPAILDGHVHALTFRVKELGALLGTWEFIAPADEAPLTYPGRLMPDWMRESAGRSALPGGGADLASIATEDLERWGYSLLEEENDRLTAVYVELGRRELARGRLAMAQRYFSVVLESPTADVNVACEMAQLLFHSGSTAEALDLLERSLLQWPDAAPLLDARDRCLLPGRPKSSQLIAFYLPQFHPVEENNLWWGEGFTEWANVSAATPLYDGHVQPRRPTALGFYDLRLPEVANAQFALARQYGVDAFCYHYYWFKGRRLLSRPLEDLVAGRTGPFPFCICWANEDWTRSWDGNTGEVLIAQDHSEQSDVQFIKDVAGLLKHPDYVRVDGRPVLLVYRPDKLSNPGGVLHKWREWCRREGVGDIHVCAVQSFGFRNPQEHGFDSAVEFPPHFLHKVYPDIDWLKPVEVEGLVPGFEGNIWDYQCFSRAFSNRPREPYALHHSAMLAWDNTARKGKGAHVFDGFSVQDYEAWLQAAVGRNIRENGHALTFVNAWNEWAEGAVLEPEAHYGHEPLEATRRAKAVGSSLAWDTYWAQGTPQIPLRRLAGAGRVILVGHDAFRAGSQLNLLNMARAFKRQLHCDVEVFLKAGGELRKEFERVAPTTVLSEAPEGAFEARLRQLRKLGFNKVICNSVSSGDLAPVAAGLGFQVACLVHELPSVVDEYGLQSNCWAAAENAHHLVFASSHVARPFSDRYWPDPARTCLLPQGIRFNPYKDRRDACRAAVLEEHGWSADTAIVLGCGHADIRKGVDLFIELAAAVRDLKPSRPVAFLWVGDMHPRLASYFEGDIRRLGLSESLRFTGSVADAFRFLIAGDVFALTSREDPFPSVVLEAFDAGMPVIAFEGGGGYADLVTGETGQLVPHLDVPAMAGAVARLLKDDAQRQKKGAAAEQVARRFDYPGYLRKLLALLDGVPARDVQEGFTSRRAWRGAGKMPRITALVPNYNYARYLELRLESIAFQTLEPFEIIVLDDGSTDNSVEIVERFAAASKIPVKLLHSAQNSGNPFAQWARGVAAAKGDLVWIAEADDYCEPTLLETLAESFEDPSVVLAWCDSIMVDRAGQSEGAQYKQYFGNLFGDYWGSDFRMEGRQLLETCLATANVIPNASAALIRRSATSKAQLKECADYQFSGDWWFWSTLAAQGAVQYTAASLNYHRRHSGSVMGRVLDDPVKLVEETAAFYQRLLLREPGLGPAVRVAMMERLSSLATEGASAALAPNQRTRLGHVVEEAAEALQPGKARLAELQSWGFSTLVVSADAIAGLAQPFGSWGALADAWGFQAVIVILGSGELLAEESAPGLPGPLVLDVEQAASIAAILSASSERERKAALRAHRAEAAAAQILGQSARVATWGLQAHCWLQPLKEWMVGDWHILAGAEFGQLQANRLDAPWVSAGRVRGAVLSCNRIILAQSQPPHALARLAAELKRPLFREGGFGTAFEPKAVNAFRVVAGISAAPAARWRELAAELKRIGALHEEEWSLRLVSATPFDAASDGDGPGFVQLRSAPADWAALGDLVLGSELAGGWAWLGRRVARSKAIAEVSMLAGSLQGSHADRRATSLPADRTIRQHQPEVGSGPATA